MASRRYALAVLASVALLLAATASTAGAEQWLTNGGFESGTDGWAVRRATPVTCPAFEGTGALGVIASDNTDPTRIQQEVFGDLPTGSYTLSGWTRVQAGTASIDLLLSFSRPNGIPIGVVSGPITTGSQYTHFSVSSVANLVPESVVIAFVLPDSEGAEVCFDGIQLTTPDTAPTPTLSPEPTLAPSVTATPTATSTSTSQPSAASTSTPTNTPPPSATATRTPTPSPSPTPRPAFGFTNGGFEQGLTGWSKYGGELTTTGSAHSGSAAGLLTSSTESTKWAYQAVPIDPSQHYEFSGHLRPGENAREAYLRISWYPTSDASGPALSTSDSSERVTGAGGGYVRLSTGAVQPPPGSASARLRVLLAPASAARASLFIDDVSFSVTAAPSPTPLPTGTPSPTAAPSSTPFIPLLGASIATPPNGSPAGIGTSPAFDSEAHAVSATADTQSAPLPAAVPRALAEAGSERADRRPATAPPEQLPDNRFTSPRAPEDGVPWAWLGGVALVVIGLGGAYLQKRQAPR